jgi:cation transport protein ChaC
MTVAAADPAADADVDAGRDLWVFGYGSLMWDPGFAYVEDAWGLLRGYHRALCILSVFNRGTAERPGLALGLDRGGACRGRVFRVTAADQAATLAYLWRREMPTGAYRDRRLPIRLDDGRRVTALVFVARPGHPQYVPDLACVESAALVATGVGCYGSALDYLRQVCRQLDAFGIADGPLHRVLAQAETLATSGASG